MLLTIICAAVAFFLAVFSCIASNRIILNLDNGDKTEEKPEEEAEVQPQKTSVPLTAALQGIAVKQWAIIAICTLLTGFACFRVQTFEIRLIEMIKAAVCCEIVMSAAIIDFFTKKIPNKLNIVFYIVGAIMLVMEFFFNKEDFTRQLASSGIGLIVGFGFLFLMSMITKGGMGMGDVKLIGGLGLTFGIAALMHCFVYSMILCLIAAIAMLVFGAKKIKDKMAFCPFLYIGLIVAVSCGTF